MAHNANFMDMAISFSSFNLLWCHLLRAAHTDVDVFFWWSHVVNVYRHSQCSELNSAALELSSGRHDAFSDV
jgi:hypothetical protein